MNISEEMISPMRSRAREGVSPRRSSNKNISDAKKRLSRLKKMSDKHEKGILQTISPDLENTQPLMRHSVNGRFLKSNESHKVNLHTSMSVSPDSHSIIPSNVVISTFGQKRKKINFNSRLGAKITKKNLYIKMKNMDKRDSRRTKGSSGSISKSSTKDLDRINSLLHKLKVCIHDYDFRK